MNSLFLLSLFLLSLFLLSPAFGQNTAIPAYYIIDNDLTSELAAIVKDLGLDKDFDAGEDGMEQISLAVIDMTKNEPHFAGVKYDNFIYPASVYKMYVAAEVLRQISEGKYFLTSPVIVKAPNDVDHSKELSFDPRPLLRDGDTVTVTYLLDLMITRSDNTAANCLIDLARRENINTLIHQYKWDGSEVTRKYLKRKFEDPGYENVRGTETCALHAADFMYKIYTNQLVNPWVSMQMKVFLGRQLDSTKLATSLPANAMFYHKTGWFSFWTHDVGIVDDGEVRYVIACFLPLREEIALGKFKELSRRIFEVVKKIKP
jgi:beta-lactamase class A